ncbi:MAG: hypothetical protein ABSF15_03150 [Candidatus Sulfotelmatobacter sp.]
MATVASWLASSPGGAARPHSGSAAAREGDRFRPGIIADFHRYIGGADPDLQVLTAQTTGLQYERNDVDVWRRRMDASVLPIKALAGGWTVSQIAEDCGTPLNT